MHPHYVSLTAVLLSVRSLVAAEATLPSLPTPRSFHRAAVVDQKLVLMGGNEHRDPGGRIDIYDPRQNAWSFKKVPFKHSMGLYPTVIGRQIYVLDAFDRSFRRYDLGADRWTDLKPISTPRTNGTVVAYRSQVYVIGAYHREVTERNCVEIYDPKTNKWSVGPPLPEYDSTSGGLGDHFHLAAVLDDKLHVMGCVGSFPTKHWVLDGRRWTRKADAPAACCWKTAALEAVDEKLYLLIPSLSRKAAKANVFTYSPPADKWSPSGRTPDDVPFIIFANGAIGDSIYVTGGAPQPARMWRYEVGKRRWTSSGSD